MSPSPAALDVAVVILTWNGRDDTLACLESIARDASPGVVPIVVDNGSEDRTAEAIRERFPATLVIENGENLGFAEGNNVGIRRAIELGAEFVLVLNNDTIVDSGAIPALAAFARANERVGAVGPLMYFHNPPDVVWYAGGGFDPAKGRSGRVQGYRSRRDDFRSGTTDRTTGAAMLVPAGVFTDVGLFDGDLFIQFEDVDWSLRARRAGYKIYVNPAAKIWHKVAMATGGENSPSISYYAVRNHLEVCRRHAPLRGLAAARRTAVITLVHLALSRRSRRPLACLPAVLAGWRDYRAGRLGPRP